MIWSVFDIENACQEITAAAYQMNTSVELTRLASELRVKKEEMRRRYDEVTNYNEVHIQEAKEDCMATYFEMERCLGEYNENYKTMVLKRDELDSLITDLDNRLSKRGSNVESMILLLTCREIVAPICEKSKAIRVELTEEDEARLKGVLELLEG